MNRNQKNNRTKKIIWNLIKPFLPFVLILLFIFGTVSTIVDAVFIQFVQEDSSYLSDEELELKNLCINKANELNTCSNIVDGIPTNSLLDINNRENDKMIEWSYLYSLMTFHNMSKGDKLNKDLLDTIGKYFKSVFTYTYKDFVEENENTRVTKKVFVSENLVGEQYEMLSKYLNKEFKIKGEDLENQVEIVIQSATGYFDKTENTEWLFNTSTSIKKGGLGIFDSNIQIGNGMFCWPIPGYSAITSEFGYRTHPITGVYKLHTGTDIGAPEGADFVAMADGVVVTSGTNTAYGNMVMINHGNGIVTLYAHGSKRLVKTNDIVKQGEPVLKVGSTGFSTGPHAHFEVRINDEYVNPMQFFEGGI